MKYTAAEVAEARESLLKFLQPGSKVYCILRHRSTSGMMRVISFYTITAEGEPQWLDGWIAKVLGYTMHPKHEGLKVSGCGMDMGFHVVYSLGAALFPEGFGIVPEGEHSERPNSRAEAAHWRDSLGYSFFGRNGDTSGWDNDGGYALTSRWL